jgi:hypothetical protein
MRRFWPILLLVCAASARAQFRITRVEPRRCGDRLCAAVRMQDALTVKIEQTIRSGLPAVMEFRFVLRDGRERILVRSTVSCRILCDVWKDEYRVECGPERRLFHAFDSLRVHFQALSGLPVAPLSVLPAEASCRIWIQAEVLPIAAGQDDRVRDWLVGTDADDAPFSEGVRHEGFRLSLSGLIGSLFSRERKAELQTEWFSGELFSIRALDEKAVQ